MLKIYAPACAALLGIGVLTYYQGVYTERFGEHTSDELLQYVERMNHLPLKVGDWEGEDQEMTEDMKRQYKGAHAKGIVARNYRNTRTGKVVSISLICGHSVHVSEHTPDMCYPSQGFSMPEAASPYTVERDNDQVDFQQAVFYKDNEFGEARSYQQIFWGWRTKDMPWVGPGLHASKFRFAGVPALYKLYVIDPDPNRYESGSENPCVSFIKEVLPEFDRYLSGEMDAEVFQAEPGQQASDITPSEAGS